VSEPCVHVKCRLCGTTIALAVPRDETGAAVATNTNIGPRRALQQELGVSGQLIFGELVPYPNVTQLPELEAWCIHCRTSRTIPADDLAREVQRLRAEHHDRTLRAGA
jgi:hypothetical protein